MRTATVASLLLALCASAQLPESAPIRRFVLPGFDPQTGFLTWELRGDQAQLRGQSHVDVSGMQLRLFEGDGTAEATATIRSPQARVSLEDGTASGPGALALEADAYRIAGEQWRWDNAARRLEISRDARVEISANLDNLLK